MSTWEGFSDSAEMPTTTHSTQGGAASDTTKETQNATPPSRPVLNVWTPFQFPPSTCGMQQGNKETTPSKQVSLCPTNRGRTASKALSPLLATPFDILNAMLLSALCATCGGRDGIAHLLWRISGEERGWKGRLHWRRCRRRVEIPRALFLLADKAAKPHHHRLILDAFW